MIKYVKVMFHTTSSANPNIEYKVDEVNISKEWNPSAVKGKDYGGFNYTREDCIIRWLHRGDTIYDVEVPKDAENIQIEGATTLYRTNKIVIRNPRKITDDLALYYYRISNIPEKTYYKTLAVVSIMNYKKTAYTILREKVSKDNIDEVLEEWNSFIFHGGEHDKNKVYPLVEEISKELLKIKEQ